MTENELLNELATEFMLPAIEPDEVTAPMLARKTGLSTNACKARLLKEVERGALTWRWVRIDNSVAKAFRRAV